MGHSLSLYGRPLPKPGDLPVVKCIKMPERDLTGLLASKEFEAFGYVQEAHWDRPENYVRWIRERLARFSGLRDLTCPGVDRTAREGIGCSS